MLKQMQFDENTQVWSGLISGELDAAQAPKLLSAIADILGEHAGHLHLDCTELDFVDSMGLGALVKVRKAVEENGFSMKLTKMKKRIYKLFVITGLEKTFGLEVNA